MEVFNVKLRNPHEQDKRAKAKNGARLRIYSFLFSN